MPITPLRSTYQLKVTLVDSKPPIWRRVLVQNNIALDKLHLVLQILMGWTNSHLHQFIFDGVFYGIQDNDFGVDMDVENEEKYKLNQLLKFEKDMLKYKYDFGDGWEHKILLEKIVPFEKNNKLPLCIKGKRACPPEDCGGVWGYEELLHTLSNKKDPEYDSMLEWLGGEFNSETFDIEETNQMFVEYIK